MMEPDVLSGWWDNFQDVLLDYRFIRFLFVLGDPAEASIPEIRFMYALGLETCVIRFDGAGIHTGVIVVHPAQEFKTKPGVDDLRSLQTPGFWLQGSLPVYSDLTGSN